MKHVDSWWFPDHEQHLPQWMATPKARMILNGRPAYQGKKQLAALAAVAQLGRGAPRVAVDVGGHIGLWSYNLAPAFREVHAFEPVAEHRACFVKNVRCMDGTVKDPLGLPRHAGVYLYPWALGATDGNVSIHTAPTSSGDSWVKGAGDTPMTTLDHVGLDGVDFIKVDCEGYEENVLRGAIDTIKRDRPVIIVEQKRDMATARFGLEPLGAVKFLLELGYVQQQELSGDYLMVPA